ncbi:MAG TPA: low molecular weight protein-tyrosine-phosphatase [Frankiaceae bacterium]|nr:low molecular weight protein-tyrosine-phosphatase [Frankiaceae bacterium]
MTFRVVFVCMGNICRSPTAEVVFRKLVTDAGLADRVEIASAGTGGWHVGNGADRRSLAALRERGYDGSGHRARQFERDWFDRYDLVVAMDRENERDLRRLAAGLPGAAEKIRLLRSYDGTPAGDAGVAELDVPDPYYGEGDGFARVLDMVESACAALLAEVRRNVAA